MTAVFAAGLAAFLAFTYYTLVRRSEAAIRDRFAHASRQVAHTVEDAIAQRATAFRAVARDTAIVRVVAAPDGTARAANASGVKLALGSLVARDSLPAMLVDARGRVIAAAGNALPATVTMVSPADIASAGGDDPPDKVRVGPMLRAGDRAIFWIVAPVVVGGARRGFVVQPRYVTGPRDAMQSLRELTREDLTVYSRNIDNTGWVVIPGTPASPPLRRDSTSRGLWHERPGTGRQIVEESPVGGTPWLTVIESPERSVLARLRSTVTLLALTCLLLVAMCAVVSWILGRRITRPLKALTGAAEQVAAGTYEQAIALGAGDEIGRLAVSFDEMAKQVALAQRELEQRAADAVRARADAEAANRAKSDFLAMMSHELRTPLNAIGGYASLIELGVHGPVTPEQREALRRISRSQAHLLTLINDVLNFARIDAGQMRYSVQEVRINELLVGLEALVAPQVAARRLTLRYDPCDDDLIVSADADKVRQIVLNLLSNAVKFTPELGTVSVGCDADDTTVRVTVRDTGPGIDVDRLPSIFEPFVQGHRALNRPNDGVGLGLAISRDLARGMGGDVRVETAVGVGSAFTLELPRSRGITGDAGDAFSHARGSATVG